MTLPIRENGSTITANFFNDIKTEIESISGTLLIANKDANYTLTASENALFVDATAANTTITLPPIASNDGRLYYVKKIDSSANTVTLDADGAETIDGATTSVLTNQYDFIAVIVNGAEWSIIGTTSPAGAVTETGTQTLTNKTIDADNNTISNLAHGSEVDNPTAAHGVTEIVGTSEAQTLTTKTIDADNNTISNLAHASEVDNPTSGVHGAVGTIVGTSDIQTLTNKTMAYGDNTFTGFPSGGAIEVEDNGVSQTVALKKLNFVGATLTEPVADEITVTITGGGTLNGTGIIDPTTSDDSADGYSINSLFTNTVSKESFICQLATVGAAVWRSITSTSVAPTTKLICAYNISGTVSIPTATITQTEWGTSIKDNLGIMSSNVITIPSGYTSKYMLTASLGYASAAWSGKYADVIFNVNGTDTHRFRHDFGANSVAPSSISNTAALSLSAGDTVEVKTYHNLGSSVNLTGSTFNQISLVQINDSNLLSVLCAYKHNASTSIPSIAQTTIPYDTLVSDSRSTMSSGVFTTPSGFAGNYLVSMGVGYASANFSGKYTDAVIQKNSTDKYKYRTSHSATINVSSIGATSVIALASNDTLTVKAFHNQGSAVNLQGSEYNNVYIQRIDTSIANTLVCGYAHSAATSISNITETLIPWDTLEIDTQTIMSTGVMTIPVGYGGDFLLAATVGYTSAAWSGKNVEVIYKINGSETHRFRQLQGGTVNVNAIGAFSLLSLSDGDTVEIYTYHNQGSAVNLQSVNYSNVCLVSVGAL